VLIFASAVFGLFWIAYRHNYYFVQRNKVDTHGALFENALSQLFAGVYILEVTLIGLFFLVRNEDNNVVATPQAIIMIVALILTAGFHYVMETLLKPLYDLLPVTLEDKAADAEKQRFTEFNDKNQSSEEDNETSTIASPGSHTSQERLAVSSEQPIQLESNKERFNLAHGVALTAADARKTLLRLRKRMDTRLAAVHSNTATHHTSATNNDRAHKMAAADQLGEALASYPDELTDLPAAEREATLRAAYQDPVTREPAPVVWLAQDAAGLSEDSVRRARKYYGRWVVYSDAGAYLTEKGKCEVVQPAPDVRTDWLLDWNL
jgi:hypothetical protein